MQRREAREFLLSALYQQEFVERSISEMLSEIDPGDQRDYIEQVFIGIATRRDEIDDLIGRHTVGWRFERLALIDRNILRLGVFELLHLPSIPPEVAINESVELCKKYGTERARVFVNGILDRIWKETRDEESAALNQQQP
jgi:N utilization substance protein B